VLDDRPDKIKSEWRAERRNDRTPPGFAIYQRGVNPITKKPPYIGYIGYFSPEKPNLPATYGQLSGRS